VLRHKVFEHPGETSFSIFLDGAGAYTDFKLSVMISRGRMPSQAFRELQCKRNYGREQYVFSETRSILNNTFGAKCETAINKLSREKCLNLRPIEPMQCRG
jgi:hypothetical protein